MANSKLFLGDINIRSFKLGTRDIKLYLGDSVVYPTSTSLDDAVVTCGSATYNAQTQIAEEITVVLSGNTLTKDVDYNVTQNSGGINAGDYTVEVTGINNYEGTASGTFTINKVTPTVTAPTAVTGLVYNATAQALANAGSTNFGTLKYSLDDSTYTTSIPSGTNATSYTVYYKVEGDSNVNDVPAQSVSVSIGKVTPTVVSPTAKVLTYNGSQQELVNAGSTDFGTLQYKVGSDSWSTSIPTRQRGGSYELSYKVVGDSNINDVAAQSVQCSINEKQVTATVTLSQTAYTYNGSACQPTPTVKDGSTVIDPLEYSVTYSNNINAGTGTVTISDNTGGDYEVIGSATFTINKADPTYTAPTTKTELVYNASAQALLNSGSATGGTIYYSSDNSTWSTAIPSGTNATSYTSYWKIAGDSNHNDKASASISTTISKANSSLSFSVTNITVEKGQTKTNAVTVNAGDGTVTYTSNNTSIVTVNNSGVVTGVGAGNTTVTANISEGTNYKTSSASYTASCVIAITAKFDVTSTSSPTRIASATTGFNKIEIDGVEQPSVTTGYTFSTTGEHTVKYIIKPNFDGSRAFYGCTNLKNVEIPYGITSIDLHCFYNCTGLTSVNIPNSVTWIHDDAFGKCKSLTSVTIPDSVIVIDNSAFKDCSGLTSVTIGTNVTSIRTSAFTNCTSLTSVTIPSSVTSIGGYAFTNCRILTACTIGSGVTSIYSYAFSACTSLTSIDIPDSVTSIGSAAFGACSGLTSIDIPDSVTSIGNGAFTNCNSLTSCTIGSGITSIGSNTFAYCTSLTSIDIPDSVTSIGSAAFGACSGLTTCTIGSGVTSIGDSAFYECRSLASITIPNTVTSIGNYAFKSCYSVTSCTIGSGVTSIGNYAFQYCNGLTSITCNATTAPTIQSYTFQGVKTNGTLTVPIGSSGYNVWMGTGNYYLGKYNWTKVEQ